MLLALAGLCSFVLVKGKRWVWWWLAVRGGCPFPRCPGVPVSTHCPLDQLLGCRQCCSCQGKQSYKLELQQWKQAQAVMGSSGGLRALWEAWGRMECSSLGAPVPSSSAAVPSILAVILALHLLHRQAV